MQHPCTARTYTHADTHNDVNTCMNACSYTHADTHSDVNTCMNACSYTHADTHNDVNTCMNACTTHADTHNDVNTCMNACTTHAHTEKQVEEKKKTFENLLQTITCSYYVYIHLFFPSLFRFLAHFTPLWKQHWTCTVSVAHSMQRSSTQTFKGRRDIQNRKKARMKKVMEGGSRSRTDKWNNQNSERHARKRQNSDHEKRQEEDGKREFVCLLKAYSPANRTGSPQGFTQVQIWQSCMKKHQTFNEMYTPKNLN